MLRILTTLTYSFFERVLLCAEGEYLRVGARQASACVCMMVMAAWHCRGLHASTDGERGRERDKATKFFY